MKRFTVENRYEQSSDIQDNGGKRQFTEMRTQQSIRLVEVVNVRC